MSLDTPTLTTPEDEQNEAASHATTEPTQNVTDVRTPLKLLGRQPEDSVQPSSLDKSPERVLSPGVLPEKNDERHGGDSHSRQKTQQGGVDTSDIGSQDSSENTPNPGEDISGATRDEGSAWDEALQDDPAQIPNSLKESSQASNAGRDCWVEPDEAVAPDRM